MGQYQNINQNLGLVGFGLERWMRLGTENLSARIERQAERTVFLTKIKRVESLAANHWITYAQILRVLTLIIWNLLP